MSHFLRDSLGRDAPPLRLIPTYRGEPSMANGDEAAVSHFDITTDEGREAQEIFYELQMILQEREGHTSLNARHEGDPK